MFAKNAEVAKNVGGVVGAVGHVANGTAAAFASLFDVVAPRAALDLYAAAFCNAGLTMSSDRPPVQTREAAAFSEMIYDRRFDKGGASEGGLLSRLGVPYTPRAGMEAALFKGQSGTFYFATRGTEVKSLADLKTDFGQQFRGESEAYR